MPIMRPRVLVPGPSLLTAFLGGIVGTVLFLAAVFGAGAVTVTVASLWAVIGVAVIVVAGVGVLPPALVAIWSELPGDSIRFSGAAIKGILCAIAALFAFGIAIALTIGFAPVGLVILPLASLAYGIACAVVAAMERAVSPLDALGWRHYYHGAVGGKYSGEHRSIEG